MIKHKGRKALMIVILIQIVLVVSCFTPYNAGSGLYEPFIEGGEVKDAPSNPSDTGNTSNPSNQGGLNDKLFEKDKDEKIIFKTNNLKYWGVRGYTLWKFFGKEIDKESPSITIKKIAGSEEAGCGLICYSTKKDPEDKEYRMLCILIHTDRTYSIGYIVNGKYNDIVWKKRSEKLRGGVGVINTISVKKEEEDIEIYFNDKDFSQDAQYIIKDYKEYELGQGDAGVIAVISPNDKFPENYVWVEYKTK